MSILPSQVERLPLNVEMAWGADLTASYLSWAWTDESAQLDAQTVPNQRGRSDWTSPIQPSNSAFELANLDGRYTPDLADSDLWPNVRRNTPCRLWVPGTVSALITDGDLANNASTADHPSLDITSDIDLRYEGDIDWWRGSPSTGANGSTLIGKYKATSDERSYLLWIVAGILVLSWSTDGTNANAQSVLAGQTGDAFIRVPWAKGRHAVRGAIDVNDGSGNRVITFYTADSRAGPWVQLDQVVLVGTTSIHAGTAPLEVGPVTEEITAPPSGKTYAAQVIAGLAGTDVRADPDFEAQADETTTFVDSEGLTWDLNGGAEITSRRTRFFGFIDEIAPKWPYGDLSDPADPVGTPGEARVAIAASGMLRRLGRGASPLASALYRAATSPNLGDAVIGYWSMEDGAEATSWASPIAGVLPMTFGGDWALASDSSLASSKPLPQVSSGDAAGFNGTVPARTVTQWLLSFMVRIPTGVTAPAETLLIGVWTTGTVNRWDISINAGAIILRGFDAGGVELFEDGAVPTEVFDGWTQINLGVVQQGSDILRQFFWMTASGSVFGADDTSVGTVGHPTSFAALFGGPPDGISYGHIAFTTGLGNGWLGWDTGANRGYVDEPAGRRFLRLSAEEGLAARVIGDPEATELMGPQRPLPLLQLLGECVTADIGIGPYEDRETPTMMMRTRRSLYSQPVAVTLDAGANEVAPPFEPVLDDERFQNDITVTRESGSSAREADPAIDSGDVARYETEVKVNVAEDDQLPDLAAWRFLVGSWPGVRYPLVTTELTAAPRLLDDWLDTDLGDRIQIINLPPQHPVDAVDLLIEGASEPMSPTRWTPQTNCSPAGPWQVGVLDDEVLGRLDTDGSEVESDFDAGADTSMSVDITDGPLWVTDAGEFPFEIVAGGVRLTVTAISGASSPQTFTITQTPVNGVEKTIPAGTAVSLADPLRLAL